MTQKTQKTILITAGDPAGIGAEIVCKTIDALDRELRSRLRVICHASWFAKQAAVYRCDIEGVALENVETVAVDEPGAAQVAYLERAAQLAKAIGTDVGALVTAPIHKARARASGFAHPGHTEFLASRFGCEQVAMMFVGPTMRVVLATIHVPLAEVANALTAESILSALDLGIESLARHFSIARPRVAVLGLNPHAGEGGLLGREELDVIIPAIAAAKRRHPDADIVGPLVPDAAFREKADLFVAMYHDQALIPLKLVDFDLAVNVTLGLPIVRTSPDHGTADDIAGKGIARPDSFAAALELARQMCD